MRPQLLVTTGLGFEGFRISAYLGVVRGIVVRSPGLARGFASIFSQLRGGNVKVFEDVCEEARAEAFSRMVTHASELGADAVVGMHYDATEFSQGVTEVLAYGTAVKLARES